MWASLVFLWIVWRRTNYEFLPDHPPRPSQWEVPVRWWWGRSYCSRQEQIGSIWTLQWRQTDWLCRRNGFKVRHSLHLLLLHQIPINLCERIYTTIPPWGWRLCVCVFFPLFSFLHSNIFKRIKTTFSPPFVMYPCITKSDRQCTDHNNVNSQTAIELLIVDKRFVANCIVINMMLVRSFDTTKPKITATSFFFFLRARDGQTSPKIRRQFCHNALLHDCCKRSRRWR